MPFEMVSSHWRTVSGQTGASGRGSKIVDEQSVCGVHSTIPFECGFGSDSMVGFLLLDDALCARGHQEKVAFIQVYGSLLPRARPHEFVHSQSRTQGCRINSPTTADQSRAPGLLVPPPRAGGGTGVSTPSLHGVQPKKFMIHSDGEGLWGRRQRIYVTTCGAVYVFRGVSRRVNVCALGRSSDPRGA
eukprot:983553-Amphidinium_carterae.1